jgi:hypothetical protein
MTRLSEYKINIAKIKDKTYTLKTSLSIWTYQVNSTH